MQGKRRRQCKRQEKVAKMMKKKVKGKKMILEGLGLQENVDWQTWKWKIEEWCFGFKDRCVVRWLKRVCCYYCCFLKAGWVFFCCCCLFFFSCPLFSHLWRVVYHDTLRVERTFHMSAIFFFFFFCFQSFPRVLSRLGIKKNVLGKR